MNLKSYTPRHILTVVQYAEACVQKQNHSVTLDNNKYHNSYSGSSGLPTHSDRYRTPNYQVT